MKVADHIEQDELATYDGPPTPLDEVAEMQEHFGIFSDVGD